MNLTDLKTLAEAAPPGPWKLHSSERTLYKDYKWGQDITMVASLNGEYDSKTIINPGSFTYWGPQGDEKKLAEYIAAVSPDVILKLLAQMDKLHKIYKTDFFNFIKHGDQEHQDWLESAVIDFFDKALKEAQ